MQFEVIPTPQFEKDLKKIAKKNRNVGNDIKPVLEDLEKGNFNGDVIKMQFEDSVNNIAVKIRVAPASQNVGKSGGYRLICYAEKNNGQVYLLTIYSKTDMENISNKQILELILKYCMD